MVEAVSVNREDSPAREARLTVAIVDRDSEVGGQIYDAFKLHDAANAADSDGKHTTSSPVRVILLQPSPGDAVTFIECEEDALGVTIREVIAGRFVPGASADDPAAPLSASERRILHLATKGWSDSEIAERLALETAEVKAELSAAIAKAARACTPNPIGRDEAGGSASRPRAERTLPR